MGLMKVCVNVLQLKEIASKIFFRDGYAFPACYPRAQLFSY